MNKQYCNNTNINTLHRKALPNKTRDQFEIQIYMFSLGYFEYLRSKVLSKQLDLQLTTHIEMPTKETEHTIINNKDEDAYDTHIQLIMCR